MYVISKKKTSQNPETRILTGFFGGGRGIRTHGPAQHRSNDFESFSL